MRFLTWMTTGAILSVGLVNCSKHDNSGGGGEEGFSRVIDVTGFTNEVDEKGLNEKVATSAGFLADIRAIRSDFNNPILSPDDPVIDGTDEVRVAVDSGNSYSTGAGSYVAPRFTIVRNCDEAFNNFETLFTGAEAQVLGVVGQLQNPMSVGLAGVGLVPTKTDDQSAVSYGYESINHDEDMTISGRITGGANERFIVLKNKFDMTTNYSHVVNQEDSINSFGMDQNQNDEVVVDLKKKVVEIIFDDSTAHRSDENSLTSRLNGQVVISAGKEKYVQANVNYDASSAKESVSAQYRFLAALENKDLLTFHGYLESSQGSGSLSFKIVRNQDGQCQVKDVESNLPKNPSIDTADKSQDQSGSPTTKPPVRM